MKQKKLFKTFEIHQKMEILGKLDFRNQHVAIIAPTFDESHRLIEDKDAHLYCPQGQDFNSQLSVENKKNET